MMKSAYIFICLSSLFLFACSSNIESFGSTQNLGTQLEDLNKAYNENAITEKEYKTAKEILLDKYQ